MFLGTHEPKLDEKGRFFLPAKFREQLTDGLVVTRSQDRCLAIYPEQTFREMAQKMASGPSTVKGVRDFQRMLAAGASSEVPDKQGRLSIPPALRAYAGLGKDIVVVGAIERIEIWDREAWETYSAEQESVFAQMNHEVVPGE